MSNSAIKCPHCGRIFFYTNNDICPFCKRNIIFLSENFPDFFGDIFGNQNNPLSDIFNQGDE